MRIIYKNPAYLPLKSREELREAAERIEEIETKHERPLTSTAIALLAAIKG